MNSESAHWISSGKAATYVNYELYDELWMMIIYKIYYTGIRITLINLIYQMNAQMNSTIISIDGTTALTAHGTAALYYHIK